MTSRLLLPALAACALCSFGATPPDAATRRWWSHIRVLAADSMEGREAGSAGHRKAAEYVAGRFAAAGLTAAGEGGFYQPVPLHAVRVVPETPADMVPPPRFVPGPRGYAQTPPRGYYGTITIESSAGPEPMRWPSFLSTIAQLADAPLPSRAPGSTSNFQANAADAEALFEGSGHTYAELRAMADAGQRLPSFPMSTRLRGRLVTDTREFSSDNVIAMLRGSDAALANEYVVVSAHLDGYGIGEAINGDRIYNGAFDDAAYVATLIDLAETLQSSRRRFKR